MSRAHYMTLNTLLERNAYLFADRVAFVAGDDRVTFAQFQRQVIAVAGALAGHGLERGDRIALLAPDCLEYPLIVFATAHLGATLVVLNRRLIASELGYILGHSGAKLLLFHPATADLAGAAAAATPAPPSLVPLAELRSGAAGRAETVSAPVDVSDQDTAVLMYTSAVTGKPRGAMLTHGSFIANDVALIQAYRFTADDVHLNVMPLFHLTGLGLTLACFHVGACTVIVEGFAVDKVCDAVEQHKVTFTVLVAPMIGQLIQAAQNGRDLTSLKKVTAVDRRETQHLLSHLTGATVYQGYGQTEAGHASICTIAEGEPRQATGFPVILADIRVMDEQGRLLPAGEMGELVVRGPTVMAGYFEDPQATAEVFRDGWLHTGDLGVITADGYVRFCDRKKDLIKSGGENVYPQEVEGALRQHPAVAEVCVIGVPDPQYVEGVTAVVALRPDMAATADELTEHCRKLIAGYKKPRHVLFVPELPLAGPGIVDRAKVKERYGAKPFTGA